MGSSVIGCYDARSFVVDNVRGNARGKQDTDQAVLISPAHRTYLGQYMKRRGARHTADTWDACILKRIFRT
eukprot:6212470-Pleurochrysis_carterae.AAC.2